MKKQSRIHNRMQSIWEENQFHSDEKSSCEKRTSSKLAPIHNLMRLSLNNCTISTSKHALGK